MRSPFLIFNFSLLISLALTAEAKTEEITIADNGRPILSGHLNMGGTAPDGTRIDVNSFYITRGSRPTLPVMGEFHYVRYPEAQWEQEIVKMRAGGISVLPTYIFWNLHEEKEGQWNWTGRRNLRHFIELCKKHGMEVIVRIGPFGHGEIRNGALPDWLFAKNLDIRSDDPLYLSYVQKLYHQIALQTRGLYYKDGGPIIGCQIENEHQHSAAPNALHYDGEPIDFTSASYDKGFTKIGVSVQDAQITTAERGNQHMRTLLKMAQDEGIITPIYTATGWGNAAVLGNAAIPVTSGYPYPAWAAPAPSIFCTFKDQQLCPDYSPVRYNPCDFPSASAEMGVGMQNPYKRRPIVTAEAAEATIVRTLGGGSNVIGYYMYHGGSTPLQAGGTGSFNDEPMGMPKISYDYQAPLGEFGLERGSYRTLRLLHTMLAAFADRLAPMHTFLPENAATITPTNRDDLRWAVRQKDGSGFVFLVNFQDHDTLRHDMADVSLRLRLPKETLTLPTFCLKKDVNAILPFNFDMDGALLKAATAQPLTRIMDGDTPHYFFFQPEGMAVNYVFDKATVRSRALYNNVQAGFGSTLRIKTRAGRTVLLTTLTRQQALDAIVVGGRLIITAAGVEPAEDGRTMRLTQLGNPAFQYVAYPSRQGFRPFTASVAEAKAELTCDTHVPCRMAVGVKTPVAPQVREWFLSVDYTADVIQAFMGGGLVLDDFWMAAPWRIGLKRFAAQLAAGETLNFYIRPLRAGAPFLVDMPAEAVPSFKDGPVARWNKVELVPEYTVEVEGS